MLVSPSLNANIGAAVRAMTTMGLSDLVVAAPRDPDFHADPAVHALAAGAQARVARVGRRDSLEAALADCQLAVAVSAEGREFGPPPEFPGRCARRYWMNWRRAGWRAWPSYSAPNARG